jgi:hypothetical protein
MKMEGKFNPHEVLADPNNLICKCPEIDCEWFGKCKECVALHRFCKTVPNCLDFDGKN